MTTQNSNLGYVPSGYNYIINPAFEVNQRGVTSVNTNNVVIVDMWRLGFFGDTNVVASQQSFTVGQTDIPGSPTNYLRVVSQYTSGSGNYTDIWQCIEDVRTLAGQTVTLSFWGKADATKPIAIFMKQRFGTGGSTVVDTPIYKPTLSTTWTKYTITFTVPSISGKTIGAGSGWGLFIFTSAGTDFNSVSGSLGQQSGTFEFANVKLEAGSVATPFRVPTYAEELQKCQRYLRTFGGSIAYENISTMGPAGSTTVCGCPLFLYPPMRTTPSIVAPTNYANFALNDGTNTIQLSQDPTISSTTSSLNCVTIVCTVTSGLTQYRAYKLAAYNQLTDKIILSAEL